LKQTQTQKDRAISDMTPVKKDRIEESLEKKKDISPPKKKKNLIIKTIVKI
jgi:hypothetical protein